MSAVILPLQNGSEERIYPKGYNLKVPCMLHTATVGEEKIQWVRIRNEASSEQEKHGCIGFKATELQQLEEEDTKENRSKRKNTNKQGTEETDKPKKKQENKTRKEKQLDTKFKLPMKFEYLSKHL